MDHVLFWFVAKNKKIVEKAARHVHYIHRDLCWSCNSSLWNPVSSQHRSSVSSVIWHCQWRLKSMLFMFSFICFLSLQRSHSSSLSSDLHVWFQTQTEAAAAEAEIINWKISICLFASCLFSSEISVKASQAPTRRMFLFWPHVITN